MSWHKLHFVFVELSESLSDEFDAELVAVSEVDEGVGDSILPTLLSSLAVVMVMMVVGMLRLSTSVTQTSICDPLQQTDVFD